MPQALRTVLLACALLLISPTLAAAAVQAGQPFPTNLDTTIDLTQLTGLRVALPKPDCATHPSDCADIDVLNTLDGFNVDARVSIPFSGAIDPTTVTPDTVFLANMFGDRVPLDRVVWTPATNTLHGNPQTYLDQDTPYLLVVTDGVKAADGSDLARADFRSDLNFGQTHDLGAKLYRAALLGALHWSGLTPSRIVDASLFTTQSITSLLEKVRRQIDTSTPAPATFNIGAGGARAVFNFANITSVTFHRQIGVSTFSNSTLPFSAVPVFPGAIGTAAYGSFTSPDYENAQRVIPTIGTGFFSSPTPQGTNTLYFNLWLPSGPEPANGWPVAIVGHGFTDSKQGFPITTASTLAHNGIATIAINVVGHGGGPLGTMTVTRTDGPPVTFSAGGRGIDQDGNGTIDSTEGVNAAPPFSAVGNRDGLRQTVIDLMQLVREIQVGIDVNGDGIPDLNASKIGYFGQSFGGIYGTTLMAVEPDIHAGVVNVPGGSISEIARLSPSFRPLVGIALATRTPPLYNAVPNPFFTNFVEDMPLSGLPIMTDTVPGADAIQNFVDQQIWAQAPADPVAYASHIRMDPLFGSSAKAIIVQFAKGDETVPNPTASALIRAGGLEDRATYFRNDLAFALVPGYTVKNPHTFLSNIFVPAQAQFALAAQQQIATFLASGGATTIDPDGAGPFFETPITGPLPEGLNFIP
ncbi:MAG TPA: Ig-like domain-containing protein [Gaiellaceae bacterium]|nr:Ig-like domain-containing protein [Gaiellaceae bacterium]